MLTLDALRSRPAAFRSLTGLDVAGFDALYDDFLAAQAARRRAATRTREGTPRRRAYGAGRKPDRDDRHRLLMALVRLRIYPTYELLGLLFDSTCTSATPRSTPATSSRPWRRWGAPPPSGPRRPARSSPRSPP